MNIGIVAVSGLAGAGKSTLCNVIIDQAESEVSVIAPMAEELKRVAVSLGWDGSKDDRGRRFLQDLGSVVREYYTYTWIWTWAQNFCHNVSRYSTVGMQFDDLGGPNPVPEVNPPGNGSLLFLIDDMRTPKELDFFTMLGAITVRVTGRATTLSGAAATHETEKYGESLEVSMIVDNSGHQSDLTIHARHVLDEVEYKPLTDVRNAAVDFFLANPCPVT